MIEESRRQRRSGVDLRAIRSLCVLRRTGSAASISIHFGLAEGKRVRTISPWNDLRRVGPGRVRKARTFPCAQPGSYPPQVVAEVKTKVNRLGK
jgi:hypothetical protein